MNSETKAHFKFYMCGIYVILQSIIMVTLGVLLGIIPTLFGYSGHVSQIGISLYYKVFKTMVGVEAQYDEESKAILNQLKGPVIFVTNHQSTLDCVLIGSFFITNTAIITKKETKYVPLIGQYLWTIGTIFLDRKNKKKSISQIDQVVDNIRKRDVSVWICPEGTRSHFSEPKLLPFKSGAFYMAVRAKVPIVPIVFENYHHIYDEKNKLLRPGKIASKVLAPIYTNNIDDDSTSIEKLSDECRSKMLETLHSFNS